MQAKAINKITQRFNKIYDLNLLINSSNTVFALLNSTLYKETEYGEVAIIDIAVKANPMVIERYVTIAL